MAQLELDGHILVKLAEVAGRMHGVQTVQADVSGDAVQVLAGRQVAET